MAVNLEQLLQSRRDLWRGRAPAPGAPAGLPSGYAALDEALGGRGWPRGAVTEIIGRDRSCVAAVPLLLPALAGLDPEAGWVALVDPPFIPYAPALAGHGVDLSRLLVVQAGEGAERLWALEQLLRSGACAAAMAWPAPPPPGATRRLQLAAESGGSCGFLFCPQGAEARASNAALRLRVSPNEGGFEVDILKRPGGWPVRGLRLPTAA